jgi:autotransporter-associated beta strand protein
MGKIKTRTSVEFVSAFCAIGFFISSSVFADTLGSWAIPASSIAPSLTSSANAAGTTISALGFTGTAASSSVGWGGRNFSTLATIGANESKNFNFNITANAGYQIVVNGVSNFSFISSPSGPTTWTLFYSSTADFGSATQIVSISDAGNQTKDITTTLTDALIANPITVSSGTTAYFRLVGTAAVVTTPGNTTSSGTARIPSNTTISVLGTVGTTQLASLTWNGGSTGSWNYDSGNLVWLNGLSSVAFSSGAIASINSASSLTVDAGGVLAGAFTNNISSGTTVVSGGTLSSGAILNIGAGKLSLQSSNNAAKLQNSGSGTLSLVAPGTYTTVDLTAGTIETLADGVLSGAVNASGDSILDVGTFSNTIGVLTVSESSIVGTGILNGAGFGFALDQNDRTVAVSMQGTGGLSKTGSKTLTLSGSNSFSGDISILSGTVATLGSDRLPDTTVVTMSANTILSLGGNETIKSLYASSANASAQVNLQSYILTMNVTASNQFVGSLVGTGSMVKNGSSILTLTNTSTYTGGTTMNAGSFRLQASGNKTINVVDNTVTLTSSPFGIGALNWAGGAIYSSSLNSRSIYNSVNLLGGIVTLGDSNSTTGTGDMIVSADVTGVSTTLNASCTVNAAAAVDWEQPILGSGFNLSKGGTNKLTLRSTNALSTLSVLAGILDARGSNSIGQVNVAGGGALAYAVTSTPFGNAAINLSSNAIFGQSATIGTTLSDRTISNQINVLGNVSFGIGAYTGSGGFASHLSGNIDLGGANQTLTIANATYFYGAVTNGGMNVTRTNTDLLSTKTLGLYGANSYSGGTTVSGSVDYVNNPILQLGNDSALGSGDLTLAGGGSLIVKAVSKADDIYNASRIITNSISIASGVSGVFDAGTNIVTSLDGLLSGIEITNNMTLRGMVSGQGSLVKTNSGSLTLAGALIYGGGTTVADGNLIVVKTNLTTTISSNTVFIAMSNNVVAGTYPVLPGELTGTYPAATYSGPTGATATFNETTGSVTVTTVGPVTDGYSLYLSSNGLPADTAFDSKVNGVTVGLKYAFGSANGMPQNNGITALPVVSGNQLTTYTFDVKDDSALTVTYQTSSDLVTWAPTPAQAVSPGTGSSPTGFLKKQAQATGSGKLFFRINVAR